MEGLKVDKPSEFDVMFVFSQIEDVFKVRCEKHCGATAYAKLVRKHGVNLSERGNHFLRNFLDDETSAEPYLSSYKVMRYFKKRIREAVKNITTREDSQLASLRVINESKTGSPAVTISIKEKDKPPMQVDLVFSIEMKAWPTTGSACVWGDHATPRSWPSASKVNECKNVYHLVPKQCPDPIEDVSPRILWRMSFSVAEKKLMRPACKNGCQKECLKIAKLIRGCDRRSECLVQDIKSYHLKMTMMHLMAEHPEKEYWLPSKLGPRTVDLLSRVKQDVENKKLLNFFVPSHNFYTWFNEKQVTSVSRSLGSIIKELEDDPKEYCEELLHSNLAIY